MRRFLILCLILCMLPIISLADSFSIAGFDGEESTKIWEENLFFTHMQEKTGISFTYQSYNSYEAWKIAKQNMFTSNNLPDLLFKSALSQQELIKYSNSGQLIDLLPLLPEHAPNLWKLLTENPQWLDAITLPSGKVVALPTINTMPTQNALWINKTWLDALNLSIPTDFNSLQIVLEAFLSKDPNQNGKKDEIPLSFIGSWDLKFFSHAYGVVTNDYNIYLDKENNVQFFPASNEFINLAKTLHSFYSNKLLDQNGFLTLDYLRQSNEENSPVIYGSFFAPTPSNVVGFNSISDYVVVPPFVYEGTQIYRQLFSEITRGTFAITSACDKPEELLAWVDILYSNDGAILAMAGKEGVHYSINADKTWQYIGALDALNPSEIDKISLYDTGDMPYLFPHDFFKQYNDNDLMHIQKQLELLNKYTVSAFPQYTLTDAQLQEITTIQNKLGRYVDESFAKFILGEWNFDEDILASYKQGLLENGMSELINFWQTLSNKIP